MSTLKTVIDFQHQSKYFYKDARFWQTLGMHAQAEGYPDDAEECWAACKGFQLSGELCAAAARNFMEQLK